MLGAGVGADPGRAGSRLALAAPLSLWVPGSREQFYFLGSLQFGGILQASFGLFCSLGVLLFFFFAGTMCVCSIVYT